MSKLPGPSVCEWPLCYWPYVTKHRIKPGKDGGRYVKENVAFLCPNHHQLADEGIISAQQLKDIIQMRLDKEPLNIEIKNSSISVS